MSELSVPFAKLRGIGGECACTVRMPLSKVQPISLQSRYEGIFVSVELMVPFSFGGQELVAVVNGEDATTTAKVVGSVTELDITTAQLRRSAFRLALLALDQDMRKQMRNRRSTVSPRRLKKKVRATLRRFGAWEIFNS